MSSKLSISFNNTENAFAYKTDQQLKKAKLLFATMGYQTLVSWGTRLTPWAIRVGLPVKGIIRSTIFDQFVGGETLEQTAGVAATLGKYQVQVILDYGVEGGHDGESGFDQSCEEFMKVIEYAASQSNIPFMSIKVTGLARFSLLEKLDSTMHESTGTLMKRYTHAVGKLSEEERQEWQRVLNRMHRICELASIKKIGVLIDAEETWIQDPVDALTMLMMDQLNKGKVVIYNTVQLYRHDRLAFLKDCISAAQERDFVLGVKLVRGAYMEKERERAQANGYASPIQPDKASSDRDYDAAVRLCIQHIDRVATIVASHNEESNLLAVQLLQDAGLSFSHPHVHFSQLFGMSDNITFNLAKAGCSVSKYLPFGPIEDVIPYLMRRAQENSSVAGQTGRELALIQREIKRRG